MSFFGELKRRSVFKVGIAYVVTAWVLLQLTDVDSGIVMLPEWVSIMIPLMLAIGFVPALILAWGLELTPDGIKLDKDVARDRSASHKSGHKLDYIIIVSLGLSLGYFIWESRFEQKTAEFESAVAAAEKAESSTEVTPHPIIQLDENIDKNTIAVLPFANRSTDAEDVYFTDGVHDELLTQLSKIDALSVISRTSVMEYRDTTKNLRQIAQELSVANVMEGSVQRAGNRVRINVQLIDAYTDEHLWADIFDRELTTGNLFAIQTDIAKAIVGALEATLTESELSSVADVPTDNVEAYDLYLQGRRFAQRDTMNGFHTAIELFQESLALDPGFKYAWIGLADGHISNYWIYGGDPVNRQLALEAIQKARSIDTNFAELYIAEGFYWYWGYLDYERALYNLEKAIEIMPGNDEAHMWRGWVARRAGDWDQALQSMQLALRLNPRAHFNWHEYALTFLFLHRYEEAYNAAMQARSLEEDDLYAKTTLARISLQGSGDIQTAVQLSMGAQHSTEFDIVELFILVRILARRFEEALEVARNLPNEMEIQRSKITLREDWAAQILFFMGREDEAKQAARAALFRLKGLRTEIGEDYRIDLAEARISAIQGVGDEKVKTLIQRSDASRPTDVLAAFQIKLEYARIFGLAGMAAEALEMLEPALQPPSNTSVYKLELDPAFDGMRENPEFAAMLERHR